MIIQEELKLQITYNPIDGAFVWKIKKAQWVSVGDPAGSIDAQTGYLRIVVNRKRYYAHRLAFLFMDGEFPPEQVDHIDHDRVNNAWNNLRKATKAENMSNLLKPARNTSGFKGVSYFKRDGTWEVAFNFRKINYYFGRYKLFDEAVKVYKEKAFAIKGEFYHA